MRMALCEAKAAYDEDEVPIGAVIVMDGIVISKAHNIRENIKDPTAHAEMVAIREASQALRRWRLSDCELYVTIEPCPMCAGAIVQARIKRLIYGAQDPKAGACGTIMNIVQDRFLNHRVEVTAGILEDECSGIMKDYFKYKRK